MILLLFFQLVYKKLNQIESQTMFATIKIIKYEKQHIDNDQS